MCVRVNHLIVFVVFVAVMMVSSTGMEHVVGIITIAVGSTVFYIEHRGVHAP